MYTVIGGNAKKYQFVQTDYTDTEIENFKSVAKGYVYYTCNTFDWLSDRWNFQLTESKKKEVFLEIPIEDYVIKDGKLAGFYSYQGSKKSEIIAEEGLENVLWLTSDDTKETKRNVLRLERETGEAYSAEGRSYYQTIWRLYCYSPEGRLKKTNTAFRWDEKDTLMILGNMAMPFWEEDEFVPWDYYADKIKNLIIFPGVTMITTKSFINCKNLELVLIPATIETIEEGVFDIQSKTCWVYTFSGSYAAGCHWGRGIELVLLDVKKDVEWVKDSYGIDIMEEYHSYWKRRFEQLDVIESDIQNKVWNIQKELQVIEEGLQKREGILKQLGQQHCDEQRKRNEWRRIQQREEYRTIISDDILSRLLRIIKEIENHD